MKPLDPRLLRYARDSRWYLALTGVLGVVHAAAIIAFSWGITMLIVMAFHRHVDWPGLARPAALSLVAVLVRALAGWAQQTAAQTAAGRVKRSLRAQVVAGLHPRMMRGRSAADIAIVAGRGLDALDAYFSKYLPQLVLTALATPIFVLVILCGDLASGITVICTLPLIPIFMILVGFFTQEVQQAEWTTLRRLSRHFLDVVEGLSTLKVFGRVGHQRRVIAEVADRYRVRTMKVLRVSFLSGFVLEIVSTLAVALVAVSIGTRMIAGELGLQIGLFVLLLTPEAFSPIRLVGAQYHAAQEGLQASADIFDILDRREEQAVAAPPLPLGEAVQLDEVHADYGPTATPAVSFTAAPGTITALVGPSGAGKSSVFSALLGFVAAAGTVRSGAERIDLAREHLRASVAWAGQRPQLAADTVARNIAPGDDGEVDSERVGRCLRLAALGGVPTDQVLDVNGVGISGGQGQRLAMARAYYRALTRRTPFILLDEPTSALDDATEQRVIRGWRELAAAGYTLIVITHREAVRGAADAVVHLDASRESASAADVMGAAAAAGTMSAEAGA